jgi:SAM-dependent methyltransferase
MTRERIPMERVDRDAYVERYQRRLEEHGYSPLTLGWGKPGREHVRFRVMADVVQEVDARSVLDVGCGFADLHDHLRGRGWDGRYRGLDIVPGLLEIARTREPGLDLEEADIATYRPDEGERFDVVVASGVFNARVHGEDNEAHISRSVRRMFELCERAICVDFMSTFVDFQNPDAWHTDPAWAIRLGRELSKRVKLRHDYMPFEFALAVYRADDHPGNVFEPLAPDAGRP